MSTTKIPSRSSATAKALDAAILFSPKKYWENHLLNFAMPPFGCVALGLNLLFMS
jgi:hypothetical protein